VVTLLRLPDGGRVLDIACGKAEMGLRVAERYAVEVTGVDLSPYHLRDAKAKAEGRPLRGTASFVIGDGAALAPEAGSLDLAMCVGASWIFSGHDGTLRALGAMVRPGGLVLVGEPFWRAEPPESYLQASGHGQEMFGSHARNVAAGLAAGLTPLYTAVSSEDDWDRYEALQWQAAERYAVEHPEDPDVTELLTTSRRHRDAYLEAGRDVLGWSLYLFQKGPYD
jgi:SAM-dependent methyltransferase